MPRRFGRAPARGDPGEVDGGEQRGGIVDAAPNQQQIELPRQFIGSDALSRGHRLVPGDYHVAPFTTATAPVRRKVQSHGIIVRSAVASVWKVERIGTASTPDPCVPGGGVTTMRTAGNMAGYADLNIRKAIDAGTMLGPTIDVTAPYLEGPGLPIPQVKALRDDADARKMVNYWADEGATSFKAYMHITRSELGAAAQEAHKRGLKITGHLCSVTFREAAALGIDDLEHGFVVATDFVPDKKPDECPAGNAVQRSIAALDVNGAGARDLIAELVKRRVAITSTLTIFETFVASQPSAPARALDAMLPEARRQYEQVRATLAKSTDTTWNILLRKEMQLEKMFADAGGLLVVGTDPTGFGGVVAGYSNQRALELLVQAGFSPLEAVKIATLNGAKYLGRDAKIGTIAAGKQADLIVVRGDPTARIEDVENVEIVFKQGVGYDSPKIFESVKGQVGLH